MTKQQQTYKNLMTQFQAFSVSTIIKQMNKHLNGDTLEKMGSHETISVKITYSDNSFDEIGFSTKKEFCEFCFNMLLVG